METTIPGGISRIQVFHPTWDEFKNFSAFISHIESQGAHLAGIAKIIPPPEWKPRLRPFGDDLDNMIIPAPIEQIIVGEGGPHGVYLQYSIQRNPLTVQEFRSIANSDSQCTPISTSYDLLEKRFWSSITYNRALYGADVEASVSDEDLEYWNFRNLNDILHETLTEDIAGVNTPYLYFGMWKSDFAWHTEDMDLYSINYLHMGAPKFWYGIPPAYGRRFERLAASFFPEIAKQCDAFLRHKATVIAPSVLKKFRIPYDKIVQEAGEIMVTFPYGYHAGFNLGFNLAEATNFASPRWIEYGKRCSVCTCQKDMVRIEMDPFVRRYQPERWDDWRRGLDRAPHPEDDRARKPASPRCPGSGSASAAPSRRPSLALSTSSEIPTYSASVPDSASSASSSSSPNTKAQKRAPNAKDSKAAAQSGKKARAGRRPRAVSAASASDPTPGVEAAPVSAQVSTDTAFSLPLSSPMITKSVADLTATGSPLPQSDTFTSSGFLSIADLVKLGRKRSASSTSHYQSVFSSHVPTKTGSVSRKRFPPLTDFKSPGALTAGLEFTSSPEESEQPSREKRAEVSADEQSSGGCVVRIKMDKIAQPVRFDDSASAAASSEAVTPNARLDWSDHRSLSSLPPKKRRGKYKSSKSKNVGSDESPSGASSSSSLPLTTFL